MMKKKFYKKLLIGLTPELHEIVLRRAERRGEQGNTPGS